MIVSGIQLDIVWENPRENITAMRRGVARCREEGAQLVALPEMFATGFTMDASVASASFEEAHEALSACAREEGVWLAAGLVEPADPRPYNVCVIFSPDGSEALRYRKIHPFSLAREDEHYSAGEELHSITIEGVRVTPLICYDLRFPEPFRIAAEKTDLFCVIANWPVQRSAAWRTLLRARAIENQCFVLGVNRYGDGDGHHYSGDSAIHDPLGETLSGLSEEEGFVSAEVTAESVTKVRERFGFLADRRPETYQRIERSRRL